MKYINILIRLNKFFIVVTIVLYATIFLGLLAQIVLGGFQVIVAVILSICYKRINKSTKEQIILYWCFVAIYTLLWFAGLRNRSTDFFDLIFYVLIPLSIAGYFTYILESLKQEV